MTIRRILRRCLAVLVVALPSSYLIWQWAAEAAPIFPGFSYRSFHESLSSAENPEFWTYAVWVVFVFAAMMILTWLVDKVLGRVQRDQPRR